MDSDHLPPAAASYHKHGLPSTHFFDILSVNIICAQPAEHAGPFLTSPANQADSDGPTQSTGKYPMVPRFTGGLGLNLSYIPASSSTPSSTLSTIKSRQTVNRGRSLTSKHAARRHPAPTEQTPPKIYKNIWGVAGVVGTVTNPSGVQLIDLTSVKNIVGGMCANYLDAHGYGPEVVSIVMAAYDFSTTVDEFVSKAYRCGMTVVELEWFWQLSWCP